MISAPIPDNENQRLANLSRYRILDTPPEEAFDRITRLLAKALDVDISLISLIDTDRQWFKSSHGIAATQTPREQAFCAHAILGDEVFIVEDSLDDERFYDNPLVTSAPNIRFYAGAPLITPEGMKLGTLCAIDDKPRKLNAEQIGLLKDLSRIIMDEMEMRKALQDAANELAREAHQALRMKEYYSYITHELRTPLTSIKGSMSLIVNGVFGELPKELSAMINIANKNAEKLIALVNDLLDARQVSEGTFRYDFKLADMNLMLQECCERMTGYCAENGITLKSNFGNLPTMLFDSNRMGQVILNLISNAAKFSDRGSEILLGARSEEDAVVISVSDQGPGIPEEVRPHLFQQFAKGKKEGGVRGTGLGLSIAKGIVEAHGGQITYETSSAGTTFIVTVPIKLKVDMPLPG